MGAIVLDASKVNSYVLPNLTKIENTMQEAYSTSVKLRDILPSSFVYKKTINEIVNQMYITNKEIKDIDSMISKKVDIAKKIENKQTSNIRSISAMAASIGAYAALTGAVTTSNASSKKNVSASKTTTKKETSSIYATGAKIVKSVVSGAKKIITSIGNFFKSTAAKIADGIKSIWKKFSKKITDISKKTANIVKKTFNKIKDTGAKIAKKTVSKVKKLGSSIWNGAKKLGSKIVKGTKSAYTKAKNAVKTAIDWTGDKLKKAGNAVVKATKATGAWFAKAGKTIWGGIKTAWNWATDADNWKKVGASILNATIAFTKGVVSLVESIGDFVILAGSAVATVRTALYDVGKGICTGEWDWSATEGLWDGTKSVVAYNWTNKLSDAFYDTSAGKWLDENAYAPFKSDGMAFKIMEGVGYVAGVVALTIVTFGAGGVAVGAASGVSATTMAITATAAGVGKYTAEEWNKNSISINYGGNDMEIAMDYETYSEIEKLKQGQSKTLKQQFSDSEGNPVIVEFKITSKGNGKYDIVDNYGNSVVLNSLNESSTAKGLMVGTVKGGWEGLQYYVGGQIGSAQFGSITNSIKNPVLQTLTRSGLRVALDVGTGVLEVPFQSAVTMMSEGKSFSEAWDSQGGWQAVGTQAGIAGIASFAGEAFSFKGNLNSSKINKLILSGDTQAIESGLKNSNQKYVSRALNELEDESLLKLINNVDDSTKLLIAKNLDTVKIKQYATALIKNVDSDNLLPILDNIFEHYNVSLSIRLLGTLSSDQMDNVLKNCDNLSDNTMSRFIKKTAQLYKNGTEVAMPNQKYNAFYANFREHGIKHALAVAEYSNKLGINLDSINLEETLTAALSHDFGMRGGVIVFDKGMMKKINKALVGLDLNESEILQFKNLEGKTMKLDDVHDILTKELSNGNPLFVEEDFIMNFARANHPLNSAIDIIRYSDSLPPGVDKDVVSLLAMTHSKSTSGISYFNEASQWEQCIDKLKQAADYEGVEFDADRLKGMLKNEDTFNRLQMEATIIRDGDAMSPVVVKEGKTLMQEDSYTKVEILKRRDSYDNPEVKIEVNGKTKDIGDKIETDNLSDIAYYKDGTTREVQNNFSKQIHAGELNTKYDSTIYIDSNGKKIYKASVEILDPTEVPYSTFDHSIKERLGEVKTYTNIDERSFEIVLPKEAEGTGLAEWYQKRLNETISSYETDLGKDFVEKIIGEEIKRKQEEFFKELRNSIVYR